MLGSTATADTWLGGAYETKVFFVSNEKIESSLFESTLTSLSAQKCKNFADALRGRLKITETRRWPKT